MATKRASDGRFKSHVSGPTPVAKRNHAAKAAEHAAKAAEHSRKAEEHAKKAR